MASTKKVLWTNNVGKPLTSVKHIPSEGRGHPVTKTVRHSPRAEKKDIPKKYFYALDRSHDRVKRIEKKVEDLRKERYAVQRAEYEIKKRLDKETKLTPKLNMKNKMNNLKKEKKLINLKTENAQINLNIAKSRLRSQRKAGYLSWRETFK
jgi:hypothetical protein